MQLRQAEVREQLIDFLKREHPEALPRERSDVAVDGGSVALAPAREPA